MPVAQPTPPDRYAEDAPSALVNRARAYVATAPWRYAVTMNAWPHWHVQRVRSAALGLGPGHEALWVLCRDFGYDRPWYSRTFRSVDLGGWVFWEMGTGGTLNCTPLGVPMEPAPTCRVHRDEVMWLDRAGRYGQWRCALCTASKRSDYPARRPER